MDQSASLEVRQEVVATGQGRRTAICTVGGSGKYCGVQCSVNQGVF